MATFFGEVLSVYSRAVEEDEYEDMTNENEEDEQIRREIEEKRSVEVCWLLGSQDGSLQCSDLIIGAGPNASGFIRAYLLSTVGWTAVAWLSFWNERSRGSERPTVVPGPGEPSCVLYRLESCPTVLICQCQGFVAEDQLFQFTEKVFSCVQTRDLNVTILSDCSSADYKTSDYLSGSSTPFLRCLKTSAYTHTVTCPPLEQPNICSGLAAAVLSHCQVHQISAVLYQCYSDVLHPDSASMQMFAATLSSVLKLEQSLSADVLQRVTRVSEIQSNLYT